MKAWKLLRLIHLVVVAGICCDSSEEMSAFDRKQLRNIVNIQFPGLSAYDLVQKTFSPQIQLTVANAELFVLEARNYSVCVWANSAPVERWRCVRTIDHPKLVFSESGLHTLHACVCLREYCTPAASLPVVCCTLAGSSDESSALSGEHAYHAHVSTTEHTTILVVVKSHVEHRGLRQQHRESWMRWLHPHMHVHVSVLFVVQSADRGAAESIIAERMIYNDVLHWHSSNTPFTDGTAFFKLVQWMEGKPFPTWTVVIRDTTYIVPGRLMELLQSMDGAPRSHYGGHVCSQMRPFDELCKELGAINLSDTLWPLQEAPPFAHPAFFVLSRTSVSFLTTNWRNLREVHHLDSLNVAVWLTSLGGYAQHWTVLAALHTPNCSDSTVAVINLSTIEIFSSTHKHWIRHHRLPCTLDANASTRVIGGISHDLFMSASEDRYLGGLQEDQAFLHLTQEHLQPVISSLDHTTSSILQAGNSLVSPSRDYSCIPRFHVLFYTDSMDFTGATARFWSLACELHRTGSCPIHVTWLTHIAPSSRRHSWGCFTDFMLWPKLDVDLGRVEELVRSTDAVLLANTYGNMGTRTILQLVSRQIPRPAVFVDLPNSPYPADLPATLLIAPSYHTALHEPQSSSVIVSVVPPPLDDHVLRTADALCRIWPRKLGGRIDVDKSPEVLIHAAWHVRQMLGPDVAARVDVSLYGEPGDGYHRLCKSLIESLDLQSFVHLRGSLSRAQVVQVLSEADILVNQRAEGESFGIVHSEATALCVPVVSFYRKANTESTRPDTRLLVSSYSSRDLAEALVSVIQGLHFFRPETLLRARHAIMARLSPDRHTREIEALLHEYTASNDSHSARDRASLAHLPAHAADTLSRIVVDELRLHLSDGAGYLADFLLQLMAKAFPSHRTTLVQDFQRPHIHVVTPLDDYCGDRLCTTKIKRLVDKVGAQVVLFVSGEPINLSALDVGHAVVTTVSAPAMRPRVPHVYLPLFSSSFSERRAHSPEALLQQLSLEQAKAILFSKRGVVAYMYSRCRSHREEFFDALLAHGVPVDALGACRGASNPGDPTHGHARFAPSWHDDAVAQLEPYKFVVAVESAAIDGYVSEKIVHAFLSHAVPIYWGALDVTSYFNPEAFVNCNKYQTLDECIRRVKDVQGDDHTFLEMLRAPKMTAPQWKAVFSWRLDVRSTEISDDIRTKVIPLILNSTGAF